MTNAAVPPLDPLDAVEAAERAVRGGPTRGASHAIDVAVQGVTGVVALALLAELVVLFFNVILRATVSASLPWGEEVAQLCLEVLAFVGGAIAYRRGEHMALRVVRDRLPTYWAAILDSIANWAVLILSTCLLILSIPLYSDRALAISPSLHISESWFMVPLSVGVLLLAVFAAERLVNTDHRARTLITGGGVAAIVALIAGIMAAGFDLSALLPVLGAGIFICLIACGLPIGFVLAAVAIVVLYLSGASDPVAVALTMQGSVANFILLALPFFVLAGFLMIEGGLSRPLAELVRSIVGRMPGGLHQVTVITMYVFSGISGSKLADVAAVGTTMEPALAEEGYEPAESVAVLSASAVMGETIPPSIALLILASISTLSIGGLFLAGVVPAVVLGFVLMVVVYLRAPRGGIRTSPPVAWSDRGKALARAIPALAVPVILVGGIVGGIATPTEVSSFAVVYALIAAVAFYRVTSLAGLWRVLVDTATMSGMILFIFSAASSLSWTLTVVGLASHLVGLLTVGSTSGALFLVATLLLLIALGAVLEGVPAIVVMAPLLLPLAPRFGVDPLQYGIVLVLAMGFGSFIPPLGVGVYVAAAIFRVQIGPVIPRMAPYLLALFVGLLIVAFVPWFSLALPHAFHVQR